MGYGLWTRWKINRAVNHADQLMKLELQRQKTVSKLFQQAEAIAELQKENSDLRSKLREQKT